MPYRRELIPIHDARAPLFVGVDIGGTNTKIGVVDDDGRTVAFGAEPTLANQGPDDFVARLTDAVGRLLASVRPGPEQIKGVGIGSPGPLDSRSGVLMTPNNLPRWWNYPLREGIARALRLPAAITNDAAAAALGEYWVGKGKDYSSLAMFTLGTGVGGAIITHGHSWDGEHGAGAELGHLVIDYSEHARLCTCGLHGHLEAYASATAVVQRAQEALRAGRHSSLATNGSGEAPVTALAIDEAAETGDAFALELVQETARYVGIGVANVIYVADPCAVLIGGGMTFGGEGTSVGRMFMSTVRQTARANIFPHLREQIVIDFASLGSDAGYLGAASVARSAARQNYN
jgi:glucokinase